MLYYIVSYYIVSYLIIIDYIRGQQALLSLQTPIHSLIQRAPSRPQGAVRRRARGEVCFQK